MSSTTKYQPVATQDTDDYTSAPPSYQAPGGAAGASSLSGNINSNNHVQDDDPASGGGIFGPPRSSEDNLPDDFKFGGSVAEATVDIRNQFVRKVYTILTVQLALTAVVSSLSFVSAGYRDWIQSHAALVWVSLLGAMVFMGLTYWKRKSYPMNLVFLAAFTALEAYAISVVVSFYNVSIVLNALLITAGIFVFLTAFACQTKYDFTSWMPYLFGALWALLLFGLFGMFFRFGSTGDLIYGGLAALIFSGYILVDTQLVLRKFHVEEEIAAAISLYLDIINLFLAILRILNSQSNN